MSQAPLSAPSQTPKRRKNVARRDDLAEVMIWNRHDRRTRLTICVPTWQDDAKRLLRSLSEQIGAANTRLLVYDDGSNDQNLTDGIKRLVKAYPGPAMLITASQNRGRSWARNRLMELATTNWLLFIDADMQPDTNQFLMRYMDALKNTKSPALFVGGFSLKHAKVRPNTRLHAAQANLSECIPAITRQKAPGRYVFSSNILVHRKVLNEIQFDPDFKGWGWEDVDWGLRIAKTYPVNHIANTATHLGLDTDDILLRKYRTSGKNFARMLVKNRSALKNTSLFRTVHFLAPLPGKGLIKVLSKGIAKSRFLPIKMRVFGLKLFRATVYAEHV